jgi:hypothetical protein
MYNQLIVFILLNILSTNPSTFANDIISLAHYQQIEPSVKKLWNPNTGMPPTLLDIASRLPPATDARHSDPITYAHEGSHFLCKGKDNQHGLYLGNGCIVYVNIPPIKTARLFAAIPPSERGQIYDTYRKQGMHSYWIDRPTMVADEWLAYTHGSMVRKELGIASRSETDRFCAIMANYTWHLIRLSREKDIDVTDLVEFCRWNESRCRNTIKDWHILFNKEF